MKPLMAGLAPRAAAERGPTGRNGAGDAVVIGAAPLSGFAAGASLPAADRYRDSAAADEEFVPGLKRRWRELCVDWGKPEQRAALVSIVAFTLMLLYSYLPGLTNAYVSWANPQYAHGWIVPLFAAALLFWWRKPVVMPVPISARIAGLALLAAGFGLRLFAARYRIITIDMYTFVPAIMGIFILVGGWSVLRWSWAPLAFLIFMFPLPDEATRYLLGPLQMVATMLSTFALQTLGLEAYREGNQITLGEMHLGVVDACSGLRMLTIFCALAVALVMVGKRTWWENVIILASAIPIALLVNSIRITITGLLFQVADSEFAERVFHDWAGLVMMPMAMGLLYLEQQLLSNIFIPESEGPALVGSGGTVGFGGGQPQPKKKAAKSAPAVFGLAPAAGLGAPRTTNGPIGPALGVPVRPRATPTNDSPATN